MAQCQKSPLILSTPKLLVSRRSASLGHVVDVTADANHLLYFVLATWPYWIKCIAVMGNLFFIAYGSLRIGWFAQFSKKLAQIAYFLHFSNWPLRQFLRNCRQTKNVWGLIFTGRLWKWLSYIYSEFRMNRQKPQKVMQILMTSCVGCGTQLQPVHSVAKHKYLITHLIILWTVWCNCNNTTRYRLRSSGTVCNISQSRWCINDPFSLD